MGLISYIKKQIHLYSLTTNVKRNIEEQLHIKIARSDAKQLNEELVRHRSRVFNGLEIKPNYFPLMKKYKII